MATTTKQQWKKEFTPEEKEAYKRLKEAEKQELNELYERFVTKKTLHEVVNLISNYKELHKYSFRNRMQVLAEAESRDDKKFVGSLNSFANWKKQNISILKGSKAYKVNVPIFSKKRVRQLIDEDLDETEQEKVRRVLSYFKLGNTFDLSQTTEYENYLKDQKQIDEKVMKNAEMDYNQALTFCKENFPDVNIREEFETVRPDGAKGVFIPASLIVLYQKSSHTIFHEVGHWIASQILEKKEYAKGEVIAELNAFLFLSHFVKNLDYNFNYSNIWSSRIIENFDLTEFEGFYNKLDKLISSYFEEEDRNFLSSIDTK